MARSSSRPTLPLSRSDLKAVLRPLEAARFLPPAAFFDERVLSFERQAWFGCDWVCVGHVADLPTRGSWLNAPLTPAGVLIVRGPDDVLRAFHNACRHRGASLVVSDCGEAVRLRCPYHGWVYDLAGQLRSCGRAAELPDFDVAAHGLLPVRLETFQGLIFVCMSAESPSLADYLDDLPGELGDVDLTPLGRGRTYRFEAQANWKLVMENFLESDHFAYVHPELEQLTPSAEADSIPSRGPWQGGVMPLIDTQETVSEDGLLHGRPLVAPASARAVRDYMIWPSFFMSLQPDYLLTYNVWPLSPSRTLVVHGCYFHADADPHAPDVYRFWDRTNAQDAGICERQQVGLAAPGFVAGRYTPVEDGVHVFERFAARSYLAGTPVGALLRPRRRGR